LAVGLFFNRSPSAPSFSRLKSDGEATMQDDARGC
jgi:hypothetical protein